MVCRRHPWCGGFPPRWMMIVLGGLLGLPACWAVLLLVVPTDGARRTLAARLSQSSGRKVSLGRVSVGFLGGLYLQDLAIGSPQAETDAWLRVRQAAINVNIGDLLCGHVEPTRVELDGVQLRVLRRVDGSLELSDLLRNPEGSTPRVADEHDDEADCCPGGMSFAIRDATVTVIDEPTHCLLEFTDVAGKGTIKSCNVRLAELSGQLNGGPFDMTMEIERTCDDPRFEGQIRMQGVALKHGVPGLNYLVPALAGLPTQLDGKLDLSVYLQGAGSTHEALRKSLVGQGSVRLDPVVLDGSTLLNQLDDVVDLPAKGRVGSIRTNVVIRDGRLSTDEMTIDVGRLPLILSGWTDFEGNVNYVLRPDRLAERLPIQARNLLAELQIEVSDLADVRIGGDVDSLVVTVDGVTLHPNDPSDQTSLRLEDRERLREIGRRLRDRIRK